MGHHAEGSLRLMGPCETPSLEKAPVTWCCGRPSHKQHARPLTLAKVGSDVRSHLHSFFSSQGSKTLSSEFLAMRLVLQQSTERSGIQFAYGENGAAASRLGHQHNFGGETDSVLDRAHSSSPDNVSDMFPEPQENPETVVSPNHLAPLAPILKEDVDYVLVKLEEILPGLNVIACRKNAETCLSLGATSSQILQFFTFSPRLIFEDVSSRICESVAVLEEYGMTRTSLWAIYSRPRLKFRPANLPFLREKEKLLSILEVFRHDLCVRDVTKVLEKDVTLLHRLPESLRAKGQLLREVGVGIESHILEQFPGVLGTKTSLIRGSAATLEILLGEAYLDIINHYPLLLSVAPETLQSRQTALKNLLGVDVAVEMILKCPSLLIAQESTISTTLENLLSVFGNQKGPEIVWKYPYLLASNWNKTIGPKLDYLLSNAKRDVDDIVVYPVCLSFSLNSRIKPRFEALSAAGKGCKSSLRSILYPSNSQFENHFEVILNIPPTVKR